jgi:hypothetical protein
MDTLSLIELKSRAWDEIAVECRNAPAHDTAQQTLYIKMLPGTDQYQLLVRSC